MNTDEGDTPDRDGRLGPGPNGRTADQWVDWSWRVYEKDTPYPLAEGLPKQDAGQRVYGGLRVVNTLAACGALGMNWLGLYCLCPWAGDGARDKCPTHGGPGVRVEAVFRVNGFNGDRPFKETT